MKTLLSFQEKAESEAKGKGPKLSEFGFIEFSSPTKKEKARYLQKGVELACVEQLACLSCRPWRRIPLAYCMW